MDKPQAQQTMEALDKAYPNGWRSGNQFCDALTVILANGLREMTEALLNPRR